LFNMTRLVIIGLAIVAAATPVLAVDGAFGRSIPGTWVVPSVGVVGPDSGFSFTTFPIGYMGARGGNRLSEAFGVLLTNDEADVSINVLIPGYVWKTESQKVNFSSSFMVPVNWWGVTAQQQVNGILQRTNSANASVGDVVAIPLTVGIHFSQNNNLAFSAWVWTPTGLFQPGNISSVGMGVWTVMPNFAHTYFWEKRNLEFDNFVGFDIYGHNAATNYTSGTVFHWDGMALQYFGKKRFGIGAIGSNITQITDDRGPLAAELNGFAGRKWGVGPILLYTAKRDNPGMSFQLRWINEFEVTNMLKGNTFMAGVSLRVK
jgi:hypothetical protein